MPWLTLCRGLDRIRRQVLVLGQEGVVAARVLQEQDPTSGWDRNQYRTRAPPRHCRSEPQHLPHTFHLPSSGPYDPRHLLEGHQRVGDHTEAEGVDDRVKGGVREGEVRGILLKGKGRTQGHKNIILLTGEVTGERLMAR